MTIRSSFVDGPNHGRDPPGIPPSALVAEYPPRQQWHEAQAPPPPCGNLNSIRGAGSNHLYPRLPTHAT